VTVRRPDIARTVLIVEPDADVRRTLAACCTREGFDVVAVADGRAATSIVEAQPVAAVLTHCFMPEPDGFDLVLTLLRATPRPRLIALTEGDRFVAADALAMADRLGVDRVLAKPYTHEAVLGALEAVLR